jgi:hypothetical protein
VLLFGPPGAGKSSLLGALQRAGETQADVLGGSVVDPSGRLLFIRDHVYGDRGLEFAPAEVVEYTVRLEHPSGEWAPFGPDEVVLIDCEGKAAEAAIRHPHGLRDPRARAALRAVSQADAIVLMVGAAATDEQLLAAFQDFTGFLDTIEEQKAFSREVGGFPVFLALTQCDKLARPGDDEAAWEARVSRRKQYVLDRFAEYLEDPDDGDEVPSPYLPFGSIDLDVAAVAVRRPHLAGEPEPPDEPYGVAELFRDCFAAARAHRERMAASDRRLAWTVRAVGFAVGALAAAVIAVVLFQTPPSNPGLAEKVREFEYREPPTAAARLTDRQMAASTRALAGFRDDPGFDTLPDDLQQFVTGRLKEIEDYRAYRAKLFGASSPAEARSLEELAKTEARLRGELAPPGGAAWAETDAGRLWDKWTRDAELIRSAEAIWNGWYRDLVWRATVLTLAKDGFGGGWRADVGRLVADSVKPPLNTADPIPESRGLPLPHGEAVTYLVPSEFDRVYQARFDWETARDRLSNLRDLADALGLTAGPDLPPTVLALPDPGPGVNSLALGGDRWVVLRAVYPPQPEAYPGWALANFPEPGKAVLADRIRHEFETGTQHVRQLIRERTGASPGALADRTVRDRLAAELGGPTFAGWGRLLHLLARLLDPAAANPVAALADFLRLDRFAIDLKGLDLTIPDTLREQEVTPGPDRTLTVRMMPKPGEQKRDPITLTFRAADGPGVKMGGTTVYRFTPVAGGMLTYVPGDGLIVETTLRTVGGPEFKLTWDTGRSEVYQFDRLSGVLSGGVKLTPAAGSTVPSVPTLLPDNRGG